MTAIAPVRCKCGLQMETHRVAPAIEGGVTVDVSLCRECDRRRCGDCEQYVQDLTTNRCPVGHDLRPS